MFVDKDEIKRELDSPFEKWKLIQSSEKYEQNIPYIVNFPETTVKNPNHTRFVCLSDTHNHHFEVPGGIPNGDVLLYSGDFSMLGKHEEIEYFISFLKSTQFKYKVVIAGIA
jgi:hypothetical protein